MEFAADAKTEELTIRLLSFMDEHILPAEPVFAEEAGAMRARGRGWSRPPVIAGLKAEARRQGLWNLFLPGRHGSSGERYGAGLTAGNKGAHSEIQAIKIIVPPMAEWVIGKAVQAHGAAGRSQDSPLAVLWAQARTLRLADGPDEVHRRSRARREPRKYR